jgi:Undecaprenyl-phosphate glucose phosphotransferase
MRALDIRSAGGRGVPLITQVLGRLRLSPKGVALVACLVDSCAIVGASILAGAAYHKFTFGHVGDLGRFFGGGAILAVAMAALMKLNGLYTPDKLLSARQQVRPILLIWIGVFLFLLSASFVLKITDELSRGWIISLAATGPFLILYPRALLSRAMLGAIETGRLKRRSVILITDNSKTIGARDEMLPAYDVVRTYTVPQDRAAARTVLEAAVRAARGSKTISEVHLAMDWSRRSEISRVLSQLKALPLPVRLLADPVARDILHCPQETLYGAVSFEVQRAPLTPTERAAKRAFDVAVAALGLFAIAPFLLAIALAVRIDSPGPILFRQARGGFNGRTFKILKFRTMRVMEDGPELTQATARDDRVTRVGRWLRRTSIDELPQLINVLRGDMSLVGPRPHAVAHDVQYSRLISNYPYRHHVKPGMTGWAQVNGFRGETPTIALMRRRCELDLWYITNWSFWLDIRILTRTVVEVCRSPNAF